MIHFGCHCFLFVYSLLVQYLNKFDTIIHILFADFLNGKSFLSLCKKKDKLVKDVKSLVNYRKHVYTNFLPSIAGILLRNLKSVNIIKKIRTIIFLAKKLFRIRSWTEVCKMGERDSESGKKGERKRERQFVISIYRIR